jgi:hypothetical protein
MSEENDWVSNLDGFTGTEAYHPWSILFRKAVLTDGAKYLADKAGAYWLMDVIASHQVLLLKNKEHWFQVWHIEVGDNNNAVITCDDGNGNVLARQEIEYTNFPIKSYELYAIFDGNNLVILLKSEY